MKVFITYRNLENLIKRIYIKGYKIIGIAILFILWEILAFIYPSVLLPSVEEVFYSLYHLILNQEFWINLSHTMTRVLSGFGLSLIVGAVLGTLAGVSKKFYEIIKPLVAIIESVPPIIWIIFAILWFGLGSMPVIFAIMSIVTPIMILNLAQGIQDIDPQLLEMTDSFSIRKQTQFRHFYIPAITGYFFAALSISLGLTWRVVIMAEFLGSMTGIGSQVNWAMLNLETNKAFAYTLFIVSLGLLTEIFVVKPLKNYAQSWRRK
jgi:NitT/TauT family transport system permease protein